MGSLFKPSRSAQVAIDRISSPPPPSVSTPAVVTTPEDTGPTESEQAAEAREQSLLRRSRGRLGTVLTGFKGFLNTSDSAQSSSRKTLLGE